MYIGLDFDGVIADTNALKSILLKERYGISLPPIECTTEHVIEAFDHDKERFDAFKIDFYHNEARQKELQPLDTALSAINELLKAHTIKIVTSRYDKSFEIAQNWLLNHGLSIPAVSAGKNQPKGPHLHGYDIFVDDDIKKLEAIGDTVQTRILLSPLSHPHETIIHYRNWEELLRFLLNQQS